MPGVDVETSIVIDRPRAAVAAFAGDPDNVRRWYANIRSVEWMTPPPARVGSRIAFVAEFLGRRLAYIYEVREIEPDRRFVMSTADRPFPDGGRPTLGTTLALAGPRMTLRNRGAASGFARIGAPVMAAAMRRANGKDLAALKSVLEGG